MMPDQYDRWRQRLAGETVPTYPNEPDPGFYRVRSRDKQSWRTIAYWRTEGGALRCRLQGVDITNDRAIEIWPWASAHPIAHEVYQSVMAGNEWPDLHEAVTRSNQAPTDDSLESLKDRIEDIAREAGKITKIETQDGADQAADLANKLGELQNTADAKRAEEKRPHDDAARAVQARWKPVIDAADLAKRKIKQVIAHFLAAKEVAERKARQEAIEAGADPEPQQRASTTKAGTRGRSVALRTVKDITIADRAAVLAFFAEGQAMTEFLQAQAQAAVRAGVTVPGVTVTERKVAA